MLLMVMTAAAFTTPLTVTSLTDQSANTTRFTPGTKVNGMGIGGLTTNKTETRIEGFCGGEYTLTIKEREDKEERIKGTDIGYKVAVPGGLQTILNAQNTSGRNSEPSTDNSHTITMTATYSEEALTAKIKSLVLIGGSNVAATADARVSSYEEGQSFTIILAIQRDNMDGTKAEALIKEAVKTGRTSADIDGADCYYQVNMQEDSEELRALCSIMNRYGTATISYVFGGVKEPLAREIICSWITGSQDTTTALDQEKVVAFVAGLIAKCDMAGTARTFHIAGGKDVEVTGPYGWKLDVAGENATLTQLIQAGLAEGERNRGPVYAAAAASHTASDWENTYMEVDLTEQYVYIFQEGDLVWEAPCVAGNIAKNYDTFAGIYSLTYKEKDRILRGAKKVDGSYEYESHVDYWMPFNGGIGLYDAAWRSKFGESIYQTSGSHGCISLPPDKATILYDLVYKRIPVLCYE